MSGGQGDTPGSPEGISSLRWWLNEFSSPKRRADACGKWLTRAMLRHDVRRRVALFNAQLYEDVPALGLGPFQYAVYDLGSPRLRMNLIRAVTNTYHAMVSRSNASIRALTSGPDAADYWTLKKQAKGLTKWWDGKRDELKLDREVHSPCCMDSAVFGRGLAKVFTEWPNMKDKHPELLDVCVERTFSWELVADDAESQIPSRMRNLGHRKWYDRSVAAEMFPAHKKAIFNAPRNDSRGMQRDWTIDSAADLIAISELWHLPSYEGAGDGLHVIFIEGEVLFEGPWERMRFPFAILYRDRPSMGIYGTSIPHELRGLHTDINQALLDIQECLRLNGKPRIMAPVGSFEANAWDDDIDSIVFYNGQTPPFLYSPQVMPPEQYQFLWMKWQKGFEMIGVSQERSQGQVPQGLSGSGASIRAWNDVEDGRLYRPSKNFEDWQLEIADLAIDEARAIAKIHPKYASVRRGKTYVEIVYFKDVDPGRNKYWMHVYSESALSKNPAQRLAQLQELFNAQVITAAEFRDKLDYPDLESEDNLMNSGRALADKLITKFLEADEPDEPDVFVYPEPEWPLAELKTRMQYAEVRARLDNAPEGNVRLLRQFIGLCDKVHAKALPPAAPAGPVSPQAPPPGLPAANMNGAPPPAPAGPPPALAS